MSDLGISPLGSQLLLSQDESLSVSSSPSTSPRDRQGRHSTSSMNQLQDFTSLMFRSSSTSSTGLLKKGIVSSSSNTISISSPMLMLLSTLVLRVAIVVVILYLPDQEKRYSQLKRVIQPKHSENTSKFANLIKALSRAFIYSLGLCSIRGGTLRRFAMLVMMCIQTIEMILVYRA